jgi:arylsulfatase
MGDRTSLTLYPGMTGMMENTFLNVKGRSLTITADVQIPQGGANGVILAQGGRFGGWSVYLKDGKPAYTYNWVGLERFTVAAPEPLPPGKATIVLDFAYDGGGRGQGATATLTINGKRVAEGRIAKTNAYVFSLDEGADVGVDEDTPVTEVYQAGVRSRFTGTIDRVTLQVR